MVKIISYFISFLHALRNFLYKLECFFLKFLPNDQTEPSHSDPYKRFKVHELPIIEPEHIPIPFHQAKAAYESKHHRTLVPVFRKKGKIYPSKGTFCPHCGASHEFLSFNNGEKRTQIRCKVCENTFSTLKSYSSQIIRKCPHCGNKLHLEKSRSGFDIYKCRNPKCPHYLHELNSLSSEEKIHYQKEPNAFSLHYITHVFNASLDTLESVQRKIVPSKIDLSRIHNSKHVLGLVLTYYINYGLSLRKTALILHEVHDIKFLIRQLPITPRLPVISSFHGLTILSTKWVITIAGTRLMSR